MKPGLWSRHELKSTTRGTEPEDNPRACVMHGLPQSAASRCSSQDLLKSSSPSHPLVPTGWAGGRGMKEEEPPEPISRAHLGTSVSRSAGKTQDAFCFQLVPRDAYLFCQRHGHRFPELVETAVDPIPPSLLDHFVRNRDPLEKTSTVPDKTRAGGQEAARERRTRMQGAPTPLLCLAILPKALVERQDTCPPFSNPPFYGSPMWFVGFVSARIKPPGNTLESKEGPSQNLIFPVASLEVDDQVLMPLGSGWGRLVTSGQNLRAGRAGQTL